MTRSAAITLSLQLVMTGMTLLFGVAALRVGREREGSPRLAAWYLTGVLFTLLGATATVQSVLAVWAAASGPGSAPYAFFLRLVPIANDGRSVMVLGYAATLAALVHRGRPFPAPSGRVWAGLGGMMLLGAAVGVREGSFLQGRHMTILSILGALSVLLLLAALYGALVSNAVDYLLWAAVGVYTAREALNVNFGVVFALIGLPHVWQPAPRAMVMVAIGSLALMLAFTLRRLVLARAGRDAPSLLERLRV